MGRCNRCEVCSRLVGASVGLWPSRVGVGDGDGGGRLLRCLSLPTKEPATRNGWGSLSMRVGIIATYFTTDRTHSEIASSNRVFKQRSTL